MNWLSSIAAIGKLFNKIFSYFLIKKSVERDYYKNLNEDTHVANEVRKIISGNRSIHIRKQLRKYQKK